MYYNNDIPSGLGIITSGDWHAQASLLVIRPDSGVCWCSSGLVDEMGNTCGGGEGTPTAVELLDKK